MPGTPHLHEEPAATVAEWREGGFACAEFPAIAEIFEWVRDPASGQMRLPRTPQLRALETYRYRRLDLTIS